MTAKETLKKIAEQRRRLISMGRGRQDCTQLEIMQIEYISTSPEEKASEWLRNNKSIAYKVCPSTLKKERYLIINY